MKRMCSSTELLTRLLPFVTAAAVVLYACVLSPQDSPGQKPADPDRAEGGQAVVAIDAALRTGRVSKLVFGNNLLGYNPKVAGFTEADYNGHSDYGEGVWDPRRHRPIQKAIALAKGAGIGMLRFPGGCGAHLYDWKNAIDADRKTFRFGLDEFLRVCRSVGAEPIYTVSYFTGNAGDAADLVAYLNTNRGRWASRRKSKGIEKPWKVVYFEFGNEVYHGDHRDIKSVSPEAYAEKYLRYREKMKAVDPDIRLGAVLFTDDWNRRVLDILKSDVDFLIMHTYPSPEVDAAALKKRSPEDIFLSTYARPVVVDEHYLQRVSAYGRQKAGRKIPVAVTEYNAGFVQDEPVPYRHSLGAALLVAEMLRIFTQPDHPVFAAGYWNFVNGYWGMTRSRGDIAGMTSEREIGYVKRPSYLVFEMYHEHFGDFTVQTGTTSPGYRPDGDMLAAIRPLVRQFTGAAAGGAPLVPFVTANASVTADGKTLSVILVNRQMRRPVETRLNLKNFLPRTEVPVWILNGPDIAATNEAHPASVAIRETAVRANGDTVDLLLEPHSVTALELRLRK